jgi:hypothetical protein
MFVNTPSEDVGHTRMTAAYRVVTFVGENDGGYW